MQATITARTQETPDTFTLRLDAPLHFIPGQFVTLAMTIDGKPVKRSYSLSCGPNGQFIEITIKKKPSGYFSNQQFTVGQQLDVQGPFGKQFLYNPALQQEYVTLISAGNGIAPFRSFLQAAAVAKSATKFTLVYSVKTAADIIFKEELTYWQQQGLNLLVTLTRPTDDDKQQWDSSFGRIDASLLRPLIGPGSCYICGPTDFVQETRTILLSLGVPRDCIIEEHYG